MDFKPWLLLFFFLFLNAHRNPNSLHHGYVPLQGIPSQWYNMLLSLSPVLYKTLGLVNLTVLHQAFNNYLQVLWMSHHMISGFQKLGVLKCPVLPVSVHLQASLLLQDFLTLLIFLTIGNTKIFLCLQCFWGVILASPIPLTSTVESQLVKLLGQLLESIFKLPVKYDTRSSVFLALQYVLINVSWIQLYNEDYTHWVKKQVGLSTLFKLLKASLSHSQICVSLNL